MKKTWWVALQEYRTHVLSRRFLLGLLSVPFMAAAMVGLIFLVIALDSNTRPIGFVDHSGLLANPVPPPKVSQPDRPIEMLAFSDENAAQAALDAGQLQAYYVLPADYLTSGILRVVHLGALKSSSRSQFYNFLGANLLAHTDPAIANRLVKGADVTVESADGSRQIGSDNWFTILFPMIAGLAFITAMFTAGGYLMQAMVAEKENRTMEVLITSVSPNQFMSGKILADLAIGLTQILAWVLFILVLVIILSTSTSLTFLKGIQISAHTILLVVVILLPGFVTVAALMATIGATVAEAREGQQMVGLISLPIWIPYMLTGLIMGNPNSPVVIILSLFPLTAPLTMLLRDSLTIIPAWQIAASAVVMTLSAVGAIWLAGRAFRLGMLQYGKRLAWRQLFARRGGAA
jgi:ABC-2 type transport system permease protein